MKGQATTIDLFASLSIFILLVAFIIFFWIQSNTRLNSDIDYQETQIRALRIADTLSKTPGEPSKWESIPNSSNIANQITSLGLAYNDRILSTPKVLNFTYKLSYDNIREILNIEEYDFNFSIKKRDNITTLLKKFDIRVAYIRVGLHCSDNANRLSQLLSCTDVDTTYTVRHLCEVYKDSSALAGFLQRIDDYDLVVWEEPAGTNNPFEDPAQSIIVEDWLRNNTQGFNVLMLTGRLRGGSGDQNVLNVTWTSAGAKNDKNATPVYYTARDTREERFIQLPPDCNPDNPASDQCWIKPWSADIDNHYITPKKTKNYLPVARDKNNLRDTISRWQIGPGYVYYFSSICEPDNYGSKVFDRLVYTEELVVIALSKQLFSISITKGISPPTRANIVTFQRDVLFQNVSSLMEFNLWRRV